MDTQITRAGILTNGQSALLVIPIANDGNMSISLEFISKPAGRHLIQIQLQSGKITTEDAERLQRLLESTPFPEEGDPYVATITELTAYLFFYTGNSMASLAIYLNTQCRLRNQPVFTEEEILSLWNVVIESSNHVNIILLDDPNQCAQKQHIDLHSDLSLFHNNKTALLCLIHETGENTGFSLTREFWTQSGLESVLTELLESDLLTPRQATIVRELVAKTPLSGPNASNEQTELSVHVLHGLGNEPEAMLRDTTPEEEARVHTFWEICMRIPFKVVQIPVIAMQTPEPAGEI